MKARVYVTAAFIVLLLLPACAQEQSTPTETPIVVTDIPTTTLAPTSTPTPRPPTATPTSPPPTPTLETLPGLIPEGIEVIFAKSKRCTFSGPAELPAGEYAFVLNAQGEEPGHLQVSYLIDGKTTQDLLDHPNVQEGHWWGNAFDLLNDARASDGWRNDPRMEKYYVYSLEQGELVVLRWTQMPHFFWYCGSILVQ